MNEAQFAKNSVVNGLHAEPVKKWAYMCTVQIPDIGTQDYPDLKMGQHLSPAWSFDCGGQQYAKAVSSLSIKKNKKTRRPDNNIASF